MLFRSRTRTGTDIRTIIPRTMTAVMQRTATEVIMAMTAAQRADIPKAIMRAAERKKAMRRIIPTEQRIMTAGDAEN